MKIYEVIKNWATGEETEQDENGREISKLVIGEYSSEEAARFGTGYIVVDIYTDILDEILKNHNSYMIKVFPGNMPILTVTGTNGIVTYSSQITSLKEAVLEYYKDIPQNILFAAYEDIRQNLNNGRKKLLTNDFVILECMVNKGLSSALKEEVKVAPDFISNTLIEYLEGEIFNTGETDIKEYIRALDIKGLLGIVIDINSSKYSKEDFVSSDEFIEEYFKANPSVEELENIVGLELEYRLFSGKIVEKK